MASEKEPTHLLPTIPPEWIKNGPPVIQQSTQTLQGMDVTNHDAPNAPITLSGPKIPQR